MPNDDFMKFMKDQPFDDLDLKLDTDYLDIDLGYSKDKGARIGATIDLTSKPKSDNDIRMAAIELEREKLKFQRDMMMSKNVVVPTITKETNVVESNDSTEEASTDVPEFGGKAFIPDE